LICIVTRNRPLRRLQSFQRVEAASRREARFAARERRRAADASALGATNYDTDHSDFQEAIVANSIADSCAHRACSFLL
jgi:hypothetical protein